MQYMHPCLDQQISIFLLCRKDHTSEENKKIHHELAVYHFEIITHSIDDWFGIESSGKYNSPSFGETVRIEGFQTEDAELVLLRVTYNEQVKMVHFNRKNRSIEIV